MQANVSSRTSAFARTGEWRPRATARQQTPATVAALVSTVVPVWLASVRAGLATLGSFARYSKYVLRFEIFIVNKVHINNRCV